MTARSLAVSITPRVTIENPQRTDEVWAAAASFQRWLEKCGYLSWDPYDIWGTAYGLFSRRLYYRQRFLGLPFVAPLLAMEVIYPRWRKWFVKKERFATADGQLILAFANLYQLTGTEDHLRKAVRLAQDLVRYSVPGYRGHCWGYPFDWQHHDGCCKRNTPFITSTPYCFEANLKLFDLTADESYLGIAKSIAEFVQHDLRDTPTSSDASAGSYYPMDNSLVINASAYRAMVLFEAGNRFGQSAQLEIAWRNLNFILQSQQADGSWLYSMDAHARRFIDHFHTCFVLKNLWKLNKWVRSETVSKTIERGYAYYRKNLFGDDDLPRSFAIKPRTQLARHEMYDFAEAITLGSLLHKDLPVAFATAQRLATVVCQRFQLSDGHFVTRIYNGGLRHKLPFLRWAQAQLFYALTNLLLAREQDGARSFGAPLEAGR